MSDIRASWCSKFINGFQLGEREREREMRRITRWRDELSFEKKRNK